LTSSPARFIRGTRIFFIFSLAIASLTLSSSAPAQELSADQTEGLSWRLIGPFRGGRVTAVAGISGDPKTYYMGTPGGGVWKTTTGGVTWFPIFDDAHVASIGDLVVAPSDPNTIYVATGEQTPGNGLWKSTDAGATWTNIGIRESRTIPSILVDPKDAKTVYVAAVGDITPSDYRGIYKTTDGGKSWRKVFYKDDRHSPTELCFEPGNSRVIFAVIRRIPSPRSEKPAEEKAQEEQEVDTVIIKSSDAGETWAPTGEKGLPQARRGRIGLAIAPGLSGKRVFALMRQGLFRSDDVGETWQQITQDLRVLGDDYFGRVYSDPRNPEVVYVMQTSTYKSADGGRTFAAWKGTPSGEDDHVLWIAPEDTSRIIEGTDQGAVITLDGGKIWNTWYNQPTGQFYRVATDRFFPYRLYASQQDSGSVSVPNRTDFGLITYRDWFPTGSFESAFIAPDPLDVNSVYSIGWYGVILRMNRTTGQVATIFLPPASYRVTWETPLIFSPRDPHALYYGSQFVLKTTDGGTSWKEISGDLTSKTPEPAGAAKPMENGHTLTKDANEFSLWGEAEDGDDEAQAGARGAIQTIAPSPLDANLIWAGSTTGLIHLTRDGSSWSDVTPANLPENPYINCVEASPHDANTAYAAVFAKHDTFSLLYAPRDVHPYFYRTRDAGKTWEKIVTGLPEDGMARTIREDPGRKGLLFAGTANAIYVSFDSGDHWQPLQLNLPTATVTDLAIHSADLVASTFGRGLWILDDISALRQWSAKLADSPVQFFLPEPAIRVRWDNYPDTPLQTETSAAHNPADGAVLQYFQKSPSKSDLTLDVYDQQGNQVRHYSSQGVQETIPPPNVPEYWFYPPDALPNQAGVNRFVWDLHYAHPTALPYGYFGARLKYTEYTLPDHSVPGETPRVQPPGPLAAPGTYDLVFTREGKSYKQKLQVLPDPRVRIGQEDYAAQLALSRKISAYMEDTAHAFQAVVALHQEYDARKKSLAANSPKELSDAMGEFEKQLHALEDGNAEAPGFGILNRDLGHDLVMVQSADMKPAESAFNAVNTGCQSIAKNIAAWNKLNTETLPALNKLLAGQNMHALPLASAASAVPTCKP
jgi:photosystem II stability/assembly factor-like uncharacterized protein